MAAAGRSPSFYDQYFKESPDDIEFIISWPMWFSLFTTSTLDEYENFLLMYPEWIGRSYMITSKFKSGVNPINVDHFRQNNPGASDESYIETIRDDDDYDMVETFNILKDIMMMKYYKLDIGETILSDGGLVHIKDLGANSYEKIDLEDDILKSAMWISANRGIYEVKVEWYLSEDDRHKINIYSLYDQIEDSEYIKNVYIYLGPDRINIKKELTDETKEFFYDALDGSLDQVTRIVVVYDIQYFLMGG